MGLIQFTNQTRADATEVNKNFNIAHGTRVIYTGTDFNTTSSDSSQTNDHVINVGAGVVSDYVIIEVCARSIAYAANFGPSNNSSTTLRLSVEETGEGYTERFNQTISSAIAFGSVGDAQSNRDSQTAAIRFYYEPTLNEKKNGMNIKIESTSASGPDSSSSFANVQTIIHLH